MPLDELRSLIGYVQQDIFLFAGDIATQAVATHDRALDSALVQLPPTLRRTNTTLVNLRATLQDLRPLVRDTRPAAKPQSAHRVSRASCGR